MKREVCARILRKDATKLSTDVESFVEENMGQYSIAIETWLAMMPDELGYFAQEMMEAIGLVDTIKVFDELASEIILNLSVPVCWTHPELARLVTEIDTVPCQLQVCRFLKRLQPAKADKLSKETLSQFKTTLNKAKLMNRRDLTKPGFLNDILDIASEKLKKIMGKAPKPVQIFEAGSMPPGKNPEGHKALALKWSQIAFTRIPVVGGGLEYPFIPGDQKWLTMGHNWFSASPTLFRHTPKEYFYVYVVYTFPTDVDRPWSGRCYLADCVVTKPNPFRVDCDNEDVIDVCDAIEIDRKKVPKGADIQIFLCRDGQFLFSSDGIHGRYITHAISLPEDNTEVTDMWALAMPLDYPGLDVPNANVIDFYTSKVEAVPKSIKSARIIAHENTTRQFLLGGIVKMTWDHVISYWRKHYPDLPLPCDPDSEANSQLGAYMGSIDGRYATIDWSQASDLMSYRVNQRVLPPEHFRLRARLRAQSLLIEGKLVTNHFWATMGARNTWADMSLVLWAICEACGDLYCVLCKIPRSSLLPTIMWGDDTLLDTAIAEFCVDVLENLGMVCNHDKSFISGPYREACGVEYYNGTPCESVYWPRQALSLHKKDEAESYAMLCDMQHRLWEWPSAARVITQALRDLMGERFTSCLPLTERLEPWSAFPMARRRNNPYYEGKGDPRDVVEEHTVVEAKVPKIPSDLHNQPRWRNYLMVKYVEYLKFGPKYSDDPLLRSLGITESRINGGDFGGGSPYITTAMYELP